MRATAAPEEGNKVRLSVEIDEAEIDEALDEVVRRLSREVRVPGFRPGKVPRRVIEARMGGAAALRGEALREALPEFYARAVSDTEVDPIDQPEIDITVGRRVRARSPSTPWSWSGPTVAIPGYQGLVVTLPEPRGHRRGDRPPSSTACGPPRASWSRWPARPRTATR